MFELLKREKEKWVVEQKNSRDKISKLSHQLDMMEKRTKHLVDVIQRVGDHKDLQFEFAHSPLGGGQKSPNSFMKHPQDALKSQIT